MERGAASLPAGLTASDDRFLVRLAHGLRDRGLTAPAVLTLECLKPTAFLSGQAMRALSPFVKLITSGQGMKSWNPWRRNLKSREMILLQLVSPRRERWI